jgi:peptide/nickel transport system permease protein
VAGFFGGWPDGIIMRLTDGMLSIPLFFFAMMALALWGASLTNLVGVIALSSWMPVARVVRGEVLKVRTIPFVEAARAVGNGPARVLFMHVLPQSYPAIIVAATLGVAYNILQETALSFLGLGVQPPTPSWGNMLTNARQYMFSQPILAVYPGTMIFVTVLLYNALGDGIRDAFDPASEAS